MGTPGRGAGGGSKCEQFCTDCRPSVWVDLPQNCRRVSIHPKEETMRYSAMAMLVCVMGVAAGCTISDTAGDLRGIKGIDGDKLTQTVNSSMKQ